MHPFDITVGVIILFCLIRGIFRGLVKEISSITGVVAGYYMAYSYYLPAAELLSKYLSFAAYSRFVAFIIIFCAVFLVVSIVGVILKYLLKISFLGWTDRICGAIFGLIKGFLIACVLFIAFAAFLPKESSAITKSYLAPYLYHLPKQAIKITNKEMKKQFAETMESLHKVWKRK